MPDKNLPSLSGKKKNIPITTILEYANQGLNDTEIAKLVGCSKQNISERLAAWRADFKGVKTFKQKRADILAMFQQKLLYSLTPKDIKNMPGGSRVLAMCQLYDKERLERGKPGQIVEYQDLQNELSEVNNEIKQLEQELAELGG